MNLGSVLGQLRRLDDAVAELRRALELFEAITHDYPAARQFIKELNACRLSLGGLLSDATGGAEESERILRDAVASLERLCDADEDDPSCRTRLAQAIGNLAACLTRSDPEEAMALFRRAIAENAVMIESEPGNPEWSSISAEWFVWIAMMQARSGDLHAGVSTLEEADRLMPRDARTLRRMASHWSYFVLLVERGSSLDDAERKRLHADCLGRGLDALCGAIEAGYDDFEALRRTKDMGPLRASDGWSRIERLAEQRTPAESP
jgi:tetratricopeptide (TPR) repeat protein